MSLYYLSLGSNIGDREKYLRSAIDAIAALPKTIVVSVSSFYETAAWGKTDQDDFLNLCMVAQSDLCPQTFLAGTQQIEKSLDRVRHEHWGPRTLDIDILMIDDQIIDEERLKVPHPYMTERAFVLKPLAEIAQSAIHPQTNQTIQYLLDQTDSGDVVWLKSYIHK
ncbi:2-amino-4-hydroxy-6-hydroxymethyldihydropteridine diphosphokinase [Streptococcus moroccensis]|uniref:2-amino-4-hydroxy-6-hydroxymethyldihydropteridine diphosphokinase n=1 Tax=Streptococcus moroccensis TaxID=1451356 RepID=A0ABT9YUR8_9STRE|nr:2-amino-4-hydroxy-6-hydroxymethyldihydropteridine diphosphokinase [Streptococcus moroccensis]MDQ0223530.1 2-amino-4-hydroxy-6-hydroxymethyldihydropteridine diphosphokinase [Streptococcus moroccensis]